jgi:trans-2-enoyl-CoA reductase
MTMEAFDTLAFAKKLKNAGVPEEQAEAMAEVQADTFRGFLDSSLATKADLKIEIRALRSDLKEEIGGLRAEIYKALLAQTFALIAAMVAAFKLFG